MNRSAPGGICHSRAIQPDVRHLFKWALAAPLRAVRRLSCWALAASYGHAVSGSPAPRGPPASPLMTIPAAAAAGNAASQSLKGRGPSRRASAKAEDVDRREGSNAETTPAMFSCPAVPLPPVKSSATAVSLSARCILTASEQSRTASSYFSCTVQGSHLNHMGKVNVAEI